MILRFQRTTGGARVTSSSSIILDGSNFGIKNTPAPWRFFPLLTDTNGTDSMSVAGLTPTGTIGMEQYNADGAVPRATVQTSTALVGKELRTTYTIPSNTIDGGGWTPAMGSFLPAGTTQAYASFWLYATRTGGDFNDRFQWKTPRGGGYGSAPHSDGNNNYNSSGCVKFHSEFYPAADGTSTGTGAAFDTYYNDSSGTSHDYGNEVPGTFRVGFNFFDQWHRWEIYWNAGTAGGSDGSFYYWCDGALVGRRTGQPIRLSGATANAIEQLMFLTGLQNVKSPTDRTLSMAVARPYLDYTYSNIKLINNATSANQTDSIPIYPTVWTDTHIEADFYLPNGVPTGFNWAEVTNASGTKQVYAL